MNEFVDIKGFEGFFKINSIGEVFSYDRVVNTGNGFYIMKAKKLAIVIRQKYPSVSLCMNGGRVKKFLHVLLAEHFIPNPNNFKFVRHLNDDKLDFRLENLAWGTHADNAADAIRNGKFVFLKPENNPQTGKKGKLSMFYREKSGRARLVLDLNTGIFYETAKDAAEAKNVKYKGLARKLLGRRKNNTGMVYV